MGKKYKTKNEEIEFFDKYINIINLNEYGQKQDILIKYSSMDCIIYLYQKFLSLIIIGILFCLAGILLGVFMKEGFIVFIGMITGVVLIASYFLSSKEIIQIKTPSYSVEVLYSDKIYNSLTEYYTEQI